MTKERLYFIDNQNHGVGTIRKLLSSNKQIKFVSLLGIDLRGNVTDEKIPVSFFLNDLEGFLSQGIQTDGSSVVLDGIATLDNAKVDIIPDLEATWYVDYNEEFIDEETNLPVGILKIPSYLVHNGQEICSRSILKRAKENFKHQLLTLLSKVDLSEYGINNVSEIDDILLTTATELEFWVKTPEEQADIDKLSTSQILKEQYWKKTRGVVRTALEKTLILMENYGLEPEMGHKEVGGVIPKLNHNGHFDHVMEQIEIDWKYQEAMLASDSDFIVRDLVDDVFQQHGLEVSFKAKVVEGVAGSGKHTHIGIALKLKNGKIVNLFAKENDYLSPIGYGALMGILKNYEVINPFVSSTTDAFNRLKPGFEAPVCIVTALGKTKEEPSRNRSVLIGLVREVNKPKATRFELRAPNPLSNTYLYLSAVYQAMLDGIRYVVDNKKASPELERELSKEYGEATPYLDKNRVYRSEVDVFEDYTAEERNKLFGMPPRTVYENVLSFSTYPDKRNILLENDVFTDKIINSFIQGVIHHWSYELRNRILVDYRNELRTFNKKDETDLNELDEKRWAEISDLRRKLMKDSLEETSLFGELSKAIDQRDYPRVSELQVQIAETMTKIRKMYHDYQENLM